MIYRINFAVWVSLLTVSSGTAGEPDTSPRPYPIPTMADHARAGYPLCISKLAHPDRNHRYLGGWIGGGCLFKGEGRSKRYDGTFGYDYVAFGRFPGRVFLGWCHCRERQPGAGSYETTGPEVVDIFAAKPIQHAVAENREEHGLGRHGEGHHNGHGHHHHHGGHGRHGGGH